MLNIEKYFILRFYERFMSDFRVLVKFRSFLKGRKNIKLLKRKRIIYHFKARDLEISNI